MSLEQMNKPELVKLARSTQQELKEVNQTLEDLKKELEELKKEKVQVESELNLPFTAVATIPNGKIRLSRLIQIKFDLEGNSKVELDKEMPDHQASFKAEEILAKMDRLNKIKE